MQLSAHLVSTTGEASASAQQVTNAVDDLVGEIAAARPAFENIDGLDLGLVLSHPLAATTSAPARARYHAPTKTVFATASVHYEAWLDESWKRRVDALGDALVAAVGAVAKSRLTHNERETVLGILDEALGRAKESPPEVLTPLEAVYLNFYDGSEQPSVAFGKSPVSSAATQVIELRPSELASYLATHATEPAAPASIFKLYRRREGFLDYHEAWIGPDEVVEHWGMCGQRGEIRRHAVGAESNAFAVLRRLNGEARAKGFKPIPLTRHGGLIVERPIDGFGSPDDLQRRHELQAFLDETLGWLGLGHCDGGSTGSGSMEAYCLVVDGPRALELLNRELASSAFSDCRVRLSPEGN